MRRTAAAIAMAIVMFARPSIADDHPTFQSLWAEATQNADCKPPADYPDFILVSCNSGTTLWYFTKANHPAHPAVIKRVIQQTTAGTWTAHQDGRWFGRASSQPAFKAWYDDLDRQMQEQLKREPGSASPDSK